MTPGKVFFVRAILSLAAAFFLSRFYFQGLGWAKFILLAGLMLGLAYVFEAIRRSKGRDGSIKPS